MKSAGTGPIERGSTPRARADELVFGHHRLCRGRGGLFTGHPPADRCQPGVHPLTVGGGIRTLEDFDRVLKCGADKVSVNSRRPSRNPDLIRQAALRYGDQCVVLSMDVKRVDGQFRLFAKGGREDTGMEAIGWIRHCVDLAPGKWWSTPSTPTASSRALTWRCWPPCAVAVKVPVTPKWEVSRTSWTSSRPWGTRAGGLLCSPLGEIAIPLPETDPGGTTKASPCADDWEGEAMLDKQTMEQLKSICRRASSPPSWWTDHRPVYPGLHEQGARA